MQLNRAWEYKKVIISTLYVSGTTNGTHCRTNGAYTHVQTLIYTCIHIVDWILMAIVRVKY